MTTKYLTGAYPGGYALNTKYSGLVLQSTATVGGTGVSASALATIANYGAIQSTTTGSYGVYLGAGGIVTNGSATHTSALITGYDGVRVHGSATIANFGTIRGVTSAGVYLSAAGTVTNGSAAVTTALIEGGNFGVRVTGVSSTLVNYGTIETANGLAGATLDGGVLTNGSAADTTALIEGHDFGVLETYDASATVTNFGTIRSDSDAVRLSTGGTVTNGSAADATALIESSYATVQVGGGPAVVRNYGTIQGQGASGLGVYLFSGGAVTNGSATDTKAVIAAYGGAGVKALAVATVANFGTILGLPYGVHIRSGGAVTNGSATDTTALIEGNKGVYAHYGSAKVTNFGTIQGRTQAGVSLFTGGSVINGSAADTTALITAYFSGVETLGVATVTNFGTIAGTAGEAVLFSSTTDVLVVEAGSVFVGYVLGGGGTLDLASGVGKIGSLKISSLTGGNVTVSGSMPITTFTNFGTVEISKGARFTLTGAGTIAGGGTATLVDDGVFRVTGALTIGGTVSGAGTLTFASGTQTVNAGATISVAHWSLTGGTTTINTSLAYGGAFTEGVGATLALVAGDKLALTGATALSGTIHGAGRVTVSNATASGLTIGGTVRLEDAGAVDQTGMVTIGDTTTKAAALITDAGATWTIAGGGGIARGAATTSTINNNGTLTDQAAGTTIVGVKVVDSGSMMAAVGTLDFTRALTGTGAMSVDGGATLEVDNTTASTLSMTFNGGNAVLALKDPSAFAATINGFAPTDSIDLLGKQATSAKLGAGDTLVIRRNAKVIATLQLAGTYTGDTFTAASDGKGGTSITVTSSGATALPSAPALRTPHAFIAAAASLGAASGGAHATTVAHDVGWRTILSAPRAMVA